MVLAAVAVFGGLVTVSLGCVQIAMIGAALTYAVSSWREKGYNNSGFKAADIGFWKWNLSSVKPL